MCHTDILWWNRKTAAQIKDQSEILAWEGKTKKEAHKIKITAGSLQANVSLFTGNLKGGINIWLLLHWWKMEKAEILIEIYSKLKNIMCLRSWEQWFFLVHILKKQRHDNNFNVIECFVAILLHVWALIEMYFNYIEIQSSLKGKKRGTPCRMNWKRTLLTKANVITSNAMI